MTDLEAKEQAWDEHKGKWANECVLKEHDPIDPETLHEDPAEYAIEAGLVDNHHDPEIRNVVGAWRWSPLSLHRHRIVPLIRDHNTIDFGGAAAPVGYGATVVDMYHPLYKAVYDVPGDIDCIFTSHTIEHIPHVVSCIGSFYYRLKRPGYLIVLVPSYKSVHLRAENFPHHCHTFCLSTDQDAQRGWVPLDLLLQAGFDVEMCCHIDGSLLAIAKTKE